MSRRHRITELLKLKKSKSITAAQRRTLDEEISNYLIRERTEPWARLGVSATVFTVSVGAVLNQQHLLSSKEDRSIDLKSVQVVLL